VRGEREMWWKKEISEWGKGGEKEKRGEET